MNANNVINGRLLAHPPLRRVSRGPKVPVLPTDETSQVLFASVASSAQQRNIHNNNVGQQQQQQQQHCVETQDSCYSSCSEESTHSCLSRETSTSLPVQPSQPSETDVLLLLNNNNNNNNDYDYVELVQFATKLGYSETQLSSVLAKLGGASIGRQDRVLAELIKLGKKSTEQKQQQQQRVVRTFSAPATNTVVKTKNITLAGGFLRPILIDGSDLAITWMKSATGFSSCCAVQNCIKFFKSRGHNDIKVLLFQLTSESSSAAQRTVFNQYVLEKLQAENKLILTSYFDPAGASQQQKGNVHVMCILQMVSDTDAVIVSNENYSDILSENPKFLHQLEQHLLRYTFVDGNFVPLDEPLNQRGAATAAPLLSLTNTSSSSSQQLCPYGRKCTYGNKCKFFHPERPNGILVSVTERLLKENSLKKCLSARPSLLRSTNAATTDASSSRKVENNPHHMTLNRTRSLNVPVSTMHNQMTAQMCRMFSAESTQMPSSSHLTVPLNNNKNNNNNNDTSWQRHQLLNRNSSEPVHPSLATDCCHSAFSSRVLDRKNDQQRISVSDTHLQEDFCSNPVRDRDQQMILESRCDSNDSALGHDDANFFVPSTAVWGHSEFSVGPILSPAISVKTVETSAEEDKLRRQLYSLFDQSDVVVVQK